MAGCGALWGLAIGIVTVAWLSTIFNMPSVEITITLAAAYLTFLSAEALGLSGVLAVVALGLYMGKNGKTRISPEVRCTATIAPSRATTPPLLRPAPPPRASPRLRLPRHPSAPMLTASLAVVVPAPALCPAAGGALSGRVLGDACLLRQHFGLCHLRHRDFLSARVRNARRQRRRVALPHLRGWDLPTGRHRVLHLCVAQVPRPQARVARQSRRDVGRLARCRWPRPRDDRLLRCHRLQQHQEQGNLGDTAALSRSATPRPVPSLPAPRPLRPHPRASAPPSTFAPSCIRSPRRRCSFTRRASAC